MHRTSIIATALLFAFFGIASADVAETETAGQFLLSIPARSIDPIIDHCSESVPEIKNDLLAERAGFIEKLNEAGKPLMEELKHDPEFNAPVQERLRQEIATANSYALNIFKQQDPVITCRVALQNIKNATAENLRKVVEDTYQKFRSSGQAEGSE